MKISQQQMSTLLCLYVCLCHFPLKSSCASENLIKSKSFWYERNQKIINEKLRGLNIRPESLPKVKNVILFIGDGMGSTTLTATRVFKYQNNNNKFHSHDQDDDAKLIFDDFPASAFVRTDTLNTQIPESAAAATALFCGVKTNYELLGFDVTADPLSCVNSKAAETQSIISWAQEKNLKTGFVTTARITHATPAALYSHSRRHMEDGSKTNTTSMCKDIAKQLIEDETGKRINVILGGGMRSFVPKVNDSQPHGRIDGRNLTDEWLTQHDDGDFVTNKNELLETTANYVLGIFANSHMKFHTDEVDENQPTLTEMTLKAIQLLSRGNDNGFLLVVESAKIDLAHHFNNAYRALDETLELEKAVEETLKVIDKSETLIIVTSDHASSLTYSGHMTPKNFSILGMDKYLSDENKTAYQLLLYASGPGRSKFNETIARNNPQNSYHKSNVPLFWANHDATDVPLYATGPLSNILFSGSIDQSYVAHAIAFSMCLFQYDQRCLTESQSSFRRVAVDPIRELRRRLYQEQFEIQTTSTTTEDQQHDDYYDESFTEESTSQNIINDNDGEIEVMTTSSDSVETSINHDIVTELKTFVNESFSHLDLKSTSTDNNKADRVQMNFQIFLFTFIPLYLFSSSVYM